MKKQGFVKFDCGTVADVVFVGEEGCMPEKVEILEAQTEDAAKEKHVPFIEEKENGYLVKVGEATKHPMLDKHFIQFIEINVDGDKLYRKYLKPGDEPEVFFEVPKGDKVVAREFCNLHGLWKYEK